MKKKMVAVMGLLLFCFAERIHADNNRPMLLSILMCTLEERTEQFCKIYWKLKRQIAWFGYEDQVEVLYYMDNRENTIGFKRNMLLAASHGEYVCFVDDDDDVHDRYVPMICEKLVEKPDCVRLVGIITTRGKNPQKFVHSIQYNDKYCYENGMYVRPPNHFTPIKRSIAIQCKFPEKNFGEDYEWTMAIAKTGLIKKEAVIDEPYYFYQYDGKYDVPQVKPAKPRVSIITSVYNSDEFIEGFLQDIVRQTIFKECELIIINANSPGHEDAIITSYCEKYPNIKYERLSADPGLYGVWNYAIKKAKADLITNSNIDDRRNPQSLEMHARALEENSSIDLVYSDVYVTLHPNETFEKNNNCGIMQPHEFSPELMHKCLPGPLPMWRRSLHKAHGFFDETFRIAGDFEFWNRLALHGVRFKKVPGISGLFYQNPRGLSTNQAKAQQLDDENKRIMGIYRQMWGR